jgi:predicted ArsR family transcriptional regulator
MSTRPQLKSWNATLRSLGARQREVVEVLCHYSIGLGASQIADHLSRHPYVVRPRLTELAQMGLVQEVGERWEERTQRHEALWVLTPPDEDGQLKMAI